MGGHSVTWDANGNMLSKDGVTYAYDSSNRLTKVVSGTLIATFEYNADGLRTSMIANGVRTSYLWDVAAGMPVILTDTNSVYIYGLSLLARQTGSSVEYYHADALGSTRNLTNGSGQNVGAYSYMPFGELLLTSGTSSNRFRYTGQLNDLETGSYYLRARYYQPAAGRFQTRDPFPGYPNRPQSLNLYAYVWNNPLNFADPSGYDFLDDWLRSMSDPLIALGRSGPAGKAIVMGMADVAWYLNQQTNKVFYPDANTDTVDRLAACTEVGGGSVLLAVAIWELAAGTLTTAAMSDLQGSVWTMNAFARGRAIEMWLKMNLPLNFPVIDRWTRETGTVTSIKSIDLAARTYQNIPTVTRVVQGYVDKVATYQGQAQAWAGVTIPRPEIVNRAVDLVIPKGGWTQAQMTALQVIQQYAQSVNVTLNIIEKK